MALHGLLLMLLPPRAATRRRYQVLELCVCDLFQLGEEEGGRFGDLRPQPTHPSCFPRT